MLNTSSSLQSDDAKRYVTFSRLPRRDHGPVDVAQTFHRVIKTLKMPTVEAMSDASAIAFLLLMKRHFEVPVSDLCALLSALIPRPGDEFVEENMLAPPPTGTFSSLGMFYRLFCRP